MPDIGKIFRRGIFGILGIFGIFGMKNRILRSSFQN
jgi:hypothetical protein